MQLQLKYARGCHPQNPLALLMCNQREPKHRLLLNSTTSTHRRFKPWRPSSWLLLALVLGFVPIVRGLNPAIVWRAHSSMVGPSCHYARSIAGRTQVQKRTSLYVAIANNDGNLDQPVAAAFESIVNDPYYDLFVILMNY